MSNANRLGRMGVCTRDAGMDKGCLRLGIILLALGLKHINVSMEKKDEDFVGTETPFITQTILERSAIEFNINLEMLLPVRC